MHEDKARAGHSAGQMHRAGDTIMQKRSLVRDDGRYLIYYIFERPDRQLEQESDGEEGR